MKKYIHRHTSTYTQMPEAFILAQDSRPTAGAEALHRTAAHALATSSTAPIYRIMPRDHLFAAAFAPLKTTARRGVTGAVMKSRIGSVNLARIHASAKLPADGFTFSRSMNRSAPMFFNHLRGSTRVQSYLQMVSPSRGL